MHRMWFAVLGAKAFEPQCTGVEIDLIPAQRHNLVPPLTGQCQQFQDVSVREADVTGSANDRGKLLSSGVSSLHTGSKYALGGQPCLMQRHRPMDQS